MKRFHLPPARVGDGRVRGRRDGVVPEGHAGRPEGARRPADADGRGARREQGQRRARVVGQWLGTPPDVQYKRGSRYPDPFASEKPVATITAENMAQYAEHLTDGQKAMFKRYPATFKIIVYPSHRDFATRMPCTRTSARTHRIRR